MICSDNGLSSGRHQAIIWTKTGILLIGPLETNFSEILTKIHTFSFRKIHLEILSSVWQPFCLDLNVLTHWDWNKIAIILQNTSLNSFSRMKIVVCWIKIHWNVSSGLQLTHWGRVTHIICDIKLTIIGSDNGLSPGRRQAIIWTNAGLLLIGPLGTNFSEILIEILTFSFKKMHLKVSSAKRRPFCLGLNVLTIIQWFR